MRHAHDAGIAERLGLSWLALGCILLGLFPSYVISLRAWSPRSSDWAPCRSSDAPWWLLVPIPARQTSYAPLVFSGGDPDWSWC